MTADGPPPGAAHAYVPPRVVPPDRPLGLFGLMRTMVRNPVAAVPRVAYEAPIFSRVVGGRQVVYVCAPPLLEEVLVRDAENYPKSRIDERLFRPIFGDSLLTARGEGWRWKRRLAAPAFRQRALAAYLPAVQGAFGDLADAWAREPGAPQRVDAAMTAVTLDVIIRALFSGFDELDGRRLSAALDDYLAPASWTVALTTLRLPRATPHPGRRRMAEAAAVCRALTRGFLDRRRAGPPRADLSQALIEATDPETGRALSDEDLVDMFLTLLAAGHETTANGLAWALHCLSRMPERQEELAEVARAAGRPALGPDGALLGLEPIERFAKEAMRLLPPVPMMARRATAERRLGEVTIRPDALLFVPIYAIHRHATLWSRPEEFDPDRFAPEAERARPRCAYMPFGAGSRICIGAGLAMLEMTAGLAILLGRFRFSPAEPAEPSPIQRITLRPSPRLVLQITPRAG